MNDLHDPVYMILYWCGHCPWIDIRGPFDAPGPARPQPSATPCLHCNHLVYEQHYSFPRILAARLNHLAAFGPKKRGL